MKWFYLLILVMFTSGSADWCMNRLNVMLFLNPSYLAGLPNIQNTKFRAAAAAKSRQSCPTLCDPIDGSPAGSPVPGILQARTPEWADIFFSNAWKWKVKVKWLSCVWLLATPWTAAYQAPLSMGFSRQEYWSGVPLPSLFLGERWYLICYLKDKDTLVFRF